MFDIEKDSLMCLKGEIKVLICFVSKVLKLTKVSKLPKVAKPPETPKRNSRNRLRK